MTRSIFKLLAAPALIFVSLCAQGAPVAFSVTGTVTAEDFGNAFGLAAPDTITLSGFFDDALVTANGQIQFGDLGDGSGISFTVAAGSHTYSHTEAVDFLTTGLPIISLSGGFFTGLEFVVSTPPVYSFVSIMDFRLVDAGGKVVVGTWNESTQLVPIPAAVWLFGSGLGLLGWIRRERAS